MSRELLNRFFRLLKKYARRPWFLPVVCLLAFIDLFVIVIPTEGMIMTTSMIRPRRWLITALAVTTASSIGALALAHLGHAYGEPFAQWIMGDSFLESASWIRAQRWIDDYGFWALFFIALGPLPQQPVILVAALAGLSLPTIFLSVWLGRGPKYVLFSYLATRGERWLREEFKAHPALNRFPFLKSTLLKMIHDVRSPKD